MSEAAEATGSGGRAPPEPRWWLELARVLGETVGRARATVGPVRPAPRRRSTEALLLELGQLVSEHAEPGYEALAKEPRFWALINHLHARHKEAKLTRRRRAGPGETEPGETGPGDGGAGGAGPVDAETSGAEAASSEETAGQATPGEETPSEENDAADVPPAEEATKEAADGDDDDKEDA